MAHIYSLRRCAFCEEKFLARTDDLKRGFAKYCSKSCQVRAQHREGKNKAAKGRRKKKQRDELISEQNSLLL